MNKIFIVVGPSGAGKSSFVDSIVAELPQLVDIVTYTTRRMRAGESEGFPYHFVSVETFKKLIQEQFFVEYAEVHGNFYGTPMDQIKQAWQQNKAVIMDVDVQGARTLMQRFPQSFSIFIMPPSVDELRRRVLSRDKGSVDNLELRMQNAVKEMSMADQFDMQLTNDEFGSSYAEFKKIIENQLQHR